MKRFTLKSTLLASAMALGLAGASSAIAQQPYVRADESWITISGVVQNSQAHQFDLDYGQGIITIEMDDWDSWGEANGIIDGDHVAVSGVVDNDLFQTATIEAHSVYVAEISRHFYASPMDEEALAFERAYVNLRPGETTLRGEVTNISPARDAFTLNTGLTTIEVNVDQLGYDPLDNVGYMQLDRGDRVAVTGVMDSALLRNRELWAQSITALSTQHMAADDGAPRLATDTLLPPEVWAVVQSGDYTTEDLRQAQLEALLSRS